VTVSAGDLSQKCEIHKFLREPKKLTDPKKSKEVSGGLKRDCEKSKTSKESLRIEENLLG
jgi:hypothetical protein